LPSAGKTGLKQLLENNSYGKVYIMLGINELGYDFYAITNKYFKLVDTVKSLQPDAIIFVQANLHVTKIRSDSDKVYNNSNLDKFNRMISALADNKTVFYIDVNKNFDDENGNLSEDYSTDNTHVLGKYYMDWSEWLCTKAIAK
jgi:lysophospholipase L1-like esterase